MNHLGIVMRLRKLSIILSLFFFGVLSSVAQSTSGDITYMEGEIAIMRDGASLNSSQIQVGLKIREFDTITTGEDGYVEVNIDAPSSRSIVKIYAGTIFYFEGTPKKSSWFRTTFQLLKGSLGFKVGQLKSRESFNVQLDTVLMAVRGTEFDVEISADRSGIVTVSEGRVQSSTGRQKSTAEPGTITLIDNRSKLSSIAVEPRDIPMYSEYWRKTRLEALKIDAPDSIKHYAWQWNQTLPRLQKAMQELASQDEIFQKWDAIAKGERTKPGNAEIFLDKAAISRGMVGLRATLPVNERIFYTLVALEETSSYSGIRGDSVTQQFYKTFNEQRQKREFMLSMARRMIRIYRYIDRSAGGFPDSSLNLMDTMPQL